MIITNHTWSLEHCSSSVLYACMSSKPNLINVNSYIYRAVYISRLYKFSGHPGMFAQKCQNILE